MQTFGVIGNPIAHSLSPALHRMIYAETGFAGSYSPFLVEQNEVANVIPAMRTLGVSGFNVTSPHKRDIMPFLDEISPEAAEIGAVNTVHLREDGAAVGYNTDSFGFAESLIRAGIKIAGGSFAVCGISGAGRAVCHGLAAYGAARIVKVSTDTDKGVPYSELEQMRGMDAVINCTPLGMPPREGQSPVLPRVFGNFAAAVDLIYNPAETAFLRDARLAGCVTLNGLPMLALQGMRSFAIWTGTAVSAAAAEKIICELSCILKEKQI